MMMNCKDFPLEKEAMDLSMAFNKHPFLYEMKPEEGRKVVDKAQDSNVFKYNCKIEDRMMECSKELGSINVRILKPEHCKEGQKLPIIFYTHGAGWVFGDKHTHDKLVRELCCRTNSVVIFPEYTRCPEVKFPVPIEQSYAIMCKVMDMASKEGWDTNHMICAGDSVGGNMAIAMCMMAKMRNGPSIKRMVLYYPVTDCNFDNGSYKQFESGFYLTRDGMKWFWNNYCSNFEKDTKDILACPLKATTEQLSGLPEAMIMNGEADVLRDEGEAFGKKLRMAGVPVTSMRFNGMIHDFVMLNCLDQTKSCRSAMDVSCDFINKARDPNALKPRP